LIAFTGLPEGVHHVARVLAMWVRVLGMAYRVSGTKRITLTWTRLTRTIGESQTASFVNAPLICWN
jgi:hypothetical protein